MLFRSDTGNLQRPVRPTNEPATQSGAMLLRRQQVNVAPRSCRKTRMKFVIDRHRPANGNVVRQILIAAAHPCGGIAINGGFKMNDLKGSVNARIRSARSDYADRNHGDFRERFFEFLLHRRLFSLALPTAVSSAAILKPERPALRRFLRGPGYFYETIDTV